MNLPIISIALLLLVSIATIVGNAQSCGTTYASQNAARRLHKSPAESSASARSSNLTKIVGGNVATAHSWPAQALIYVSTSGGTSLCGGTLIEKNVVLTAAHCILSSSPTRYSVYLGVHDRSSLSASGIQQMSVKTIHKHESYSSSTLRNDIATLVLSTDATLNTNVQLACLPGSRSSTYPSSTQSSWVAGWGTTSSGGSTSSSLRNVRVTVLPSSSCSSYGSANFNQQVCAGETAGGKDSCQGDSGGPLYVSDGTKFILAGVVSYGNGCAQAGWPGVYTRTSYYTDWIAENQGSSVTLGQSSPRLTATLLATVIASLTAISLFSY